MIFTGIDLIEIDRVRKSMQNPRFVSRVFSQSEQEFLAAKQNPAASAAANFCVKEAFAKALGTGIRGFALCEVAVLRDELGAPVLILSGRAAAIAKARSLRFSVSISHTQTHATAIVVAYQAS